MSKLIAYVLDGHELDIRPAPARRAWMDATDERFAYRCLPLKIANMHGWEILNPVPFMAHWDGSSNKRGIRIFTAGDKPQVSTHFGHGILTFHVPCIFRTEPGVDLFVTGPLNHPKHGLFPLTGIIETDWAPYTFTMNWQFTRPRMRVLFDHGEPFCHLFPIARGSLEVVEPELRHLSELPEMEREFQDWSEQRKAFNANLKNSRSQAAQEGWQKNYHHGLRPSGEPPPPSPPPPPPPPPSPSHRTKLRLRTFTVPVARE